LQGALNSKKASLLDDPRETMAAFARAVGRADRDAAVDCFGEGACLITPGATTSGRRAIGSVLAQLFVRESRIDVQASSLESAHGMAVGFERWRVRSLGPVAALPRRLEATVVLRDVEGAWKLVVATLVAR
jgi:ketosteroid isomerase-like protein